MSQWRLYHIVLLWVGAAFITVAVTAFDVWRVGSFAIPFAGRPSLWRIGAILRAAAPVLPLATTTIVLLLSIALACTLWWMLLQIRRP